MSLAWSPPDDEGGAKVTGYLIEMQKVGSVTWIKCNTTPSMICEYTLTQMPAGEEFNFRVLACNSGGPGEAAEVPGTVTITEMQGEIILLNFDCIITYNNFIAAILDFSGCEIFN